MSISKVSAVAFTLCLFANPASAFEAIVSMADEHQTIHPAGATNEILATSAQTDGKFGIVTLSGAPGPGAAIIHANEAEIWYVLEGEYDFQVGDSTFSGGPGTFVAVDAGQPHSFVNKTDGKLLAIFTPGGHEGFFMEWDRLGLPRGPEVGKLEESFGVTRLAP